MNEQSAPAKVNLALDILRRRPDGYHDMRMIMQSVSLCDNVSLSETAGGFILHAEGFIPPTDKKTLEQQAVEAFFQALGTPAPGLVVELHKIIPSFAGLGGGSSDVAALLRLLRSRYAPGMPFYELERIGLQVGSDVPFCLRGGTALVQGRGEVLSDLPDLPDCRILICKPDFDLPTARMFARVTPGVWPEQPDIDGMVSALAGGDLEGVARRLSNVFKFSLPAPSRVMIEDIKDVLIRCGALGAVMSGSGPAVLGLFRPDVDTERPMGILKRRYNQVFLARPIPRYGT
ncbi:MAG: 4-(cytidine 5'-diphospho)-2-C-methyl-D-erythritol kinase [Oscillibacter sp.]|nr:4-(cytidine 5'-diphospho)-2-C-methyl-D-erythritol kinase [Oscillibacter sp.]